MTAVPADLLTSRLARREWALTVEVVTPSPGDDAAHARILTLADALKSEDRVAALTLTDRTASLDADPIALAPEVAARSAKVPLVHLAGKGRDAANLADTLRRAAASGVTSLLLTGGDPLPGHRLDAPSMLLAARGLVPALTRLAVVPPLRGRTGEARTNVLAKRDAGASAFIAQLTWDLAEREAVAGWQASVGPVLGAVMLLTRGRLEFLAAHRIAGIDVPAALRRRVADEPPEAARRRLAFDLVALRRLGYGGAHLCGLLTPALVIAVLDEADRLDATLGEDWQRSGR